MGKYFACKTEKSPIAYLPGERIEFHIACRENGETVGVPAFSWSISADFGFHEEGVSDGESGELILSASLDRPGFIFVKVTAVEKDGSPCADADPFFGGAGVGIDQIMPATPCPTDYDAFWLRCREALFSVDPVLLETKELPAEPAFPNHRIFDVRIACAGGIPVSGILTIPQTGGQFPARVIYQGYGVKSAWHDFADDEIQLCINAHGIDNDMPQEYYDELFSGKLARYGFHEEENNSPDTCYFRGMMIRAAQALRFVMTLPEWDGVGLMTRGGSQGAVQALHASALVPQVTENDVFVPWLCDIRAAKAGRLCGWGEMETIAMPYFDLTLRARTLTVPTHILAGIGDYTSPPAGVVAMFNTLRGEKSLTLVQSREHIYVSPEAEAFPVC